MARPRNRLATRAWKLLPQTLVGRVFALYTFTLLSFVGGGLVLFVTQQIGQRLDDSLADVDALVEVLMPAITDSAVIGDYDSITRLLRRASRHSRIASGSFIDLQGGVMRVDQADQHAAPAPDWVLTRIASRLPDLSQPVTAGGRDYGVIRLRFASDRLAGEMWRETLYAIALAVSALALGLLLIRWPLVRWLGSLDRMRAYEAGMESGDIDGGLQLGDSAPLEIRRTFEVLQRAGTLLQVQRERAAVTLGAIADGVLTMSSAGEVVYVNPALCRLLERSPEEMLGRQATEALGDLFGAGRPIAPWAARRQNLIASDGRVLVVETTVSAVHGPGGQSVGHVLVCRDVTEQHALDQRLRAQVREREAAMDSLRALLEGLAQQWQSGLRVKGKGTEAVGASGRPGAESEPTDDLEAISVMIAGLVQQMQLRSEQLDAVFELSPDGFVSFDDRRRVQFASPAFTNLTGLTQAEVLGLGERAFLERLLANCVDAPAWLAFDDLPRPEQRLLLRLQRPAVRTLQLSFREGDAGPVTRVLHLRDVTHETEVDQMKSEFLSTAAHELRTPMASIFGFTELMMTREMPPERRRDLLGTVHRQCHAMVAILNDLLDLARIEARRGQDFRIETCDLALLVQEAVTDFKPPGERAGPVLEIEPGLHPVAVDRDKMLQAVRNLLSNAYKFSPLGGPVRVCIQRRHDEAGHRVGVAVIDRGIGMTPEQLARTGERFYRAERSGNIPGTGLGVSIVKEIVGLLGGSLDLSSEPGEGTVVWIWLPLVEQAELQPS